MNLNLIIFITLICYQIELYYCCSEGWTSFSNSCYQKLPSIYTWSDGETVCQSYNAHLVSISNIEENNFVNDLCGEDNYCWIGGNYLGKWKWTDNSIFSDFNNNEINNCLIVKSSQESNYWYYSYCDDFREVICEYTSCEAGYYPLTSNTSCEKCPNGKYSSSGSYLCFEDYYLQNNDIQSSQELLSCPSCIIKSRSTTIAPNSLSITSLTCSAGYYSPFDGSADCIICPTGTYSSTNGLSYCDYCPSGKYSPTTGANSSSTCLTCPAGYYSQTSYSHVSSSSPSPFYGIDVGDDSVPALVDLDDDGDYDLIVGSNDGTLFYFENTGTSSSPVFIHVSYTLSNPFYGIYIDYYSFPSFVDIDNDNDYDLVMGTIDGRLYYYENIGNSSYPSFLYKSGSESPFHKVNVGYYSAPTFVDLDNDRDYDLIVGSWYGTLTYYENIGSALSPSFSLLSGTLNPLYDADAIWNSAPTFIDIDNDEDYDLIIGSGYGWLYYYENVGSGFTPSFSSISKSYAPFYGVDVGDYSIPTFIDLDNDGNDELIIGSYDGTLYYYLPTGISACTACPAGTYSLINGSTSILSCNDCIIGSYSNVSGANSSTTCVSCPIGSYSTYGASSCTTCSAGQYSSPQFYYLSGSSSPFSDFGNNYFSAPTFVDLDNDNDYDLIIGVNDGTLYYYENIGSSTSPSYSLISGSSSPFYGIDVSYYSAPSFIDLDNDGDYDLIIGNDDGTLYYFENIGSSTSPSFSLTSGSSSPFYGIDVGYDSFPSFVDLDNDNDYDLIIGSNDGTLYYYENIGSLTSPSFSYKSGSESPFYGVNVGYYTAPILIDLDNDYDYDLIVGSYDGKLYYYENIGSSTSALLLYISESESPFYELDIGYYSTPALIDLDNDNDYDLIIGAYYGTLYYYENIGSSTCSSCPAGTYSPTLGSTCKACSVGYYSPYTAATSCLICATGTTSIVGSSICDICETGYYQNNNGSCELCLDHSKCPKYATLSTIEIKKGYWRNSNDSTLILECIYLPACDGGIGSGDKLCQSGYIGPKCAVCDNDYTSTGVFGQCTECIATSLSFLIASPIALFIIVILTYFLIAHTRLQIIWYYINQLFEDHAASFKIGIAFYQIVSQFMVIFNVQYPNLFTSFLNICKISSIDLSWILTMSCVLSPNYWDKLIFMTAYPIALTLFIMFYVFISILLSKETRILFYQMKFKELIKHPYFKWKRKQAIYIFLFMVFLIYPSVCTTIFRTFVCDESFDNGESYLRADYSIKCGNNEYEYYKNYATIMIFIYPIGIPFMYLILLYQQKHNIHPDPNIIKSYVIKAKGDCPTDKVMKYMLESRNNRKSSNESKDKMEENNNLSDDINDMFAIIDDLQQLENLKEESNESEMISFNESNSRSMRRFASVNININSRKRKSTSSSLQFEKSQLQRKVVEEKLLAELATIYRENNKDLSYLKFLFDEYEPWCWWFEVVECLRRLLLTGLLVFFKDGTATQIIIAIIICVASITLYRIIRPFIDDDDDAYAEYSQWDIFIQLFFTLIIYFNVSSSDNWNQQSLTIAMIICILSVGAFLPIKYSWYYYQQNKNEKIENKKNEELESKTIYRFKSKDSNYSNDSINNIELQKINLNIIYKI